MKKTTYLIISGILSFGFLKNNLIPFINNNDILFLLMFIWSIIGFFYYKEYGVLYKTKNQQWSLLIFLIFFMSMLHPFFHYGQSLVSTFVAMRTNLIVIYFLTLLKISPSEEEFIYSFKFLGVTAVSLSILVILFPTLFVDKEEVIKLLQRRQRGSFDMAIVWPGSACAVFYFYILLQNMIKSSTLKNITLCTIFIGYIFLMQNRSTLLCAIPFYLYGLFKTESRYKYCFILVIVLFVGSYIYNSLLFLVDETTSQLSNSKYNRWQSIQYFVFDQKYNLYTLLFGHGVPSVGSAYLSEMREMFNPAKNRFVIISDIGLFGTMYYYGLSMMYILYRFVLKALRSKGMPIYLKSYAVWIFLVPTIHSFAINQNFGSTVILLTFFYLVLLYGSIDENKQVTTTLLKQ